MKDFTKGVVCAVAVGLFGKIMYEMGKRKDRGTAKALKKLLDTIIEKSEEES